MQINQNSYIVSKGTQFIQYLVALLFYMKALSEAFVMITFQNNVCIDFQS